MGAITHVFSELTSDDFLPLVMNLLNFFPLSKNLDTHQVHQGCSYRFLFHVWVNIQC